MKMHTITVTVFAPARVTDVAGLIEGLVWLGKEGAERIIDDACGGGFDPKYAKDAMSLHIKSVVAA